MKSLKQQDPAVFSSIEDETRRQNYNFELIASENFASKAVIEAMGTVLTNKYAEGYPGKRYYGGCEHVDVVEDLARDRAKKLFGAEWVNVQPHAEIGRASGRQSVARNTNRAARQQQDEPH